MQNFAELKLWEFIKIDKIAKLAVSYKNCGLSKTSEK